MADVEAICAKLQQNKPIRNRDDPNHGLLFPGRVSDEVNYHRRKRKTNIPRYVNNGERSNNDEPASDRSCGALDLTVNQHNQSEVEEEIDDMLDHEQNNLALPSFLQNPLMNIFINNRDIHENFKFVLDNVKPYDFSNPKKPKSVTNSDSKSDDDIQISISNAHDLENPLSTLIKSDTDEKDVTIKDSQTTHATEMQEECIKRFSSYEECKDEQCRKSLLRDHFHCIQCKKIIMRREEMIRHSKWHKKREESLQFNFMRFSPGDDCKESLCSYNARQTHYHCMHQGCNKIYISTSDVQMHSNFHKKDAAINQEGFRRYRATEFCCIPTCSYNNQRTTHFHCMRENCKFTFKNKADMDKHKGHHQRNDTLSQEGFRKYIKYEHCDFSGCKFSKLMNHIHCIRSNCDYVVHSSAQINSHRRKHERRILTTGSTVPSDRRSESSSVVNLSKNATGAIFDNDESLRRSPELDNNNSPSCVSMCCAKNSQFINQISIGLKDWENSLEWTSETRRFTANDPCVAHCCLLYKDHYHCLSTGCNVTFKMKEKTRDHCRRHNIDHLLLQNCYEQCNDIEHLDAQIVGPSTLHYHCKWNSCNYLRAGQQVTTESSIDFNFLQDIYDHFDVHESRFHALVNKSNKFVNKTRSKQSSDESSIHSDIYQFNTDVEKIDSIYINAERKRGRPPKYKKNIHIPRIEVTNNEDLNDDETITELTKTHFTDSVSGIMCGFKFYSTTNVFCADDMCMFYGRSEHFHCLRPRCHQATDSMTAVNLHRREFHHYMLIDPGYEYFDRSINCRRSQCQNNRVNNHYHCVRLNCDYSFKRFNTMHQHTRKHVESDRQRNGGCSSQVLDEVKLALNLENSSFASVSNYPPDVFSKSFNTLFSFPKCSGDGLFYGGSEPTMPTNVSALNLSSLIDFNSTRSPFHNSFKASRCSLFPPPAAKFPRLSLE